MFLYPLLDRFLKIQKDKKISVPLLLTIPGNHDVKWANTAFLNSYLNEIERATDERIERIKYLRDNPTPFDNLFEDYKDFVVRLRKDNKYRAFFRRNDAESLVISADYKSNGLFGYVVDKRHRLIFILMNSAWYSQGDNFNKMLAYRQVFDKALLNKAEDVASWRDKRKLDYDALSTYHSSGGDKPAFLTEKYDMSAAEELVEHFSELFKTKDAVSEYSSQVAGCFLLKLREWEHLLASYSDFAIVSCMHHPLNWLNWDVKYTHSTDKEEEPNILKEILGASDLLITGHEHVPLNTMDEMLPGKVAHLKAGCFLNDSQHRGSNFKNSWFSILSLDSARPQIWQEKYYFDTSSENLDWRCLPERSLIRFPKKKDLIGLSTNRKTEVEQFVAAISQEKLLRYFRNRKWTPNDGIFKLLRTNKAFKIFKFTEKDEPQRIFVFAQSSDFYKAVAKRQFFAMLDAYISKEVLPGQEIVFVCVDIYVEASLTKLYESGDRRRSEVFDLISKAADVKFDRMRSEFFLRFEPSKPGLPVPEIDTLKSFQHLKFVNYVIPYFDIYPYMYE
ncbi:MAG: hypothetical protein QM781_08840 [Chitinophagaceae bacterium]